MSSLSDHEDELSGRNSMRRLSLIRDEESSTSRQRSNVEDVDGKVLVEIGSSSPPDGYDSATGQHQRLSSIRVAGFDLTTTGGSIHEGKGMLFGRFSPSALMLVAGDKPLTRLLQSLFSQARCHRGVLLAGRRTSIN